MEANMAFTKKHRWDFFNRKSMRYSQVGLAQEEYVKKVLEEAQKRGDFLKVEKHLRHSEADNSGKDFTVTKVIGDDEVSKSFGVTISSRRKNYSRLKHPYTPQFYFPLPTKPETIIKAINKLFN